MPKEMTDEQYLSHLVSLADALHAIDPDYTYEASMQTQSVNVRYSDPPRMEDETIITIRRNGEYVRGYDIKQEYVSDKWRSKPNGKYRLSLDSFGWRNGGRNAKSLPQRKDGTFDYSAAAEHLLAYIRYEDRLAVDQANTQANYAPVKALRTKVGYLPGVQIMSSDTADGRPVLLSLRAEMSAELAEKILELYAQSLPKSDG